MQLFSCYWHTLFFIAHWERENKSHWMREFTGMIGILQPTDSLQLLLVLGRVHAGGWIPCVLIPYPALFTTQSCITFLALTQSPNLRDPKECHISENVGFGTFSMCSLQCYFSTEGLVGNYSKQNKTRQNETKSTTTETPYSAKLHLLIWVFWAGFCHHVPQCKQTLSSMRNHST